MLGWIVRGLMIGAGVITAIFMAKDAPLYGVVQTPLAIGLLTLFVAIVAFWPQRWIPKFDRWHRRQ
ncbi:hypothetical protein AB4Y85_01005 [Microvirga sp. 2YAF29]|uniref:hypothetical protein n=1 Tax=Microvirga sp. 2YAF29 TaxID=3233031 RepID=UPI003F944DDA